MLDALQVRGMAVRTQQAYIAAVAGLARHYGRSPDALTADEVQRYLLHLLRERKLSHSSVNQYGSACRFFYGAVLGLDGHAFQVLLARRPQRLPEILSREEIARLFSVARHAKSRTFFMLAYGTALRLSELCHLRVADIDSAADRMCIRVVQGKGGKDRYVPLACDVLEHLRAWWQLARCRDWLFCAARDATQALDAKSVQRWYRAACACRHHRFALRSAITRNAAPLLECTAETYTTHSTAVPAVQFNAVYLTPYTARAFDQTWLGVR